MARGWRLTKASWAVIRRDPTMVSIALMGAGFGLAGTAAILYFSGYFNSPGHARGHVALAAAIALYPLTFLSVFFNVALAGAAAAHFDGHPIGSAKRSASPGSGSAGSRNGRCWRRESASSSTSWPRGSPAPGGSRRGCWAPPGAWRRSSPSGYWPSRAAGRSRPPRTPSS
jgi:hypothetical protein